MHTSLPSSAPLTGEQTVALTENQSAGHLRVPNWIERKTLSHSELNVGSRWKGVKGSQLDVITCEIEIPRNQLSVKMGRYFEVKYLVDVAVCTLGAYFPILLLRSLESC